MGFLFLLIGLVGWAYLYSRMRRAEDRLNQNQYELNRDGEVIAELTRRVWALEKSQAAPAPFIPPPAAPTPPVVIAPAPPILPLREPTPVPEPLPSTPEPVAESPAPSAPPRTWRDQLRDSMGGQEWEAVVGGSWLNKLGVLVLVIGVALLLGYEFTRVGPGGRVAIGMAVGLTMLISGVFIERKQAYAIFARGFIGGGWAALYFTTYAMHAVPAAKVIDNPYLGSALLLATATGMILHSLRYRSQTVSGLAYFIAFATLALSESTPFSVLALLPLAASLLYLSHRFEWHRMAVFGLFATYATCASRPDVDAPLASTQALFAAYWLLFETFDFLRLRRSTARWTIDSLILPMNAFAFLGLSMVKWQHSAPEHLYAFLAAGAAVYLASAMLRARVRPPSSFDGSAGTIARIERRKLRRTRHALRGIGRWRHPASRHGRMGQPGAAHRRRDSVSGGIQFRANLFAATGGRRVCRIGDQECAGGPTGRRFHRLRRTHVDRLVAHGGIVGGSFLRQPHAARDRGCALQLSGGGNCCHAAGLRDAASISLGGLAGVRSDSVRSGLPLEARGVSIPVLHDWCARYRRRPHCELVELRCLRRQSRLALSMAAARHLRGSAVCGDAAHRVEQRSNPAH